LRQQWSLDEPDYQDVEVALLDEELHEGDSLLVSGESWTVVAVYKIYQPRPDLGKRESAVEVRLRRGPPDGPGAGAGVPSRLPPSDLVSGAEPQDDDATA
jgi:hypothetical protein